MSLLIFINLNAFTKACYNSIPNNCNHKLDDITLLHRKFGHLNSTVFMHLLKSCKQLKVSQKILSCHLCLLCVKRVN